MAKLRIKGVNSGITFGPPPTPTFDVIANFGRKAIIDNEDGFNLYWGMEIKQITSALVSPLTLTVGPNLVAFTQQTNNPYYSIDTSVFTVDSYYRFNTWLEDPNNTKPFTSEIVLGGVTFNIDTPLFKHVGIYDNGKGKYLQFQGYKWNEEGEQWVTTGPILTTDNQNKFTTFS